MDLAVLAYQLTAAFPSDERFGMVSQIRRSAASIPANIAEGYGRESAGAYTQHLRVSQGSLKEFETHIELSQKVGLLSEEQMQQTLGHTNEIGKMLRSLIRSVER